MCEDANHESQKCPCDADRVHNQSMLKVDDKYNTQVNQYDISQNKIDTVGWIEPDVNRPRNQNQKNYICSSAAFMSA